MRVRVNVVAESIRNPGRMGKNIEAAVELFDKEDLAELVRVFEQAAHYRKAKRFKPFSRWIPIIDAMVSITTKSDDVSEFQLKALPHILDLIDNYVQKNELHKDLSKHFDPALAAITELLSEIKQEEMPKYGMEFALHTTLDMSPSEAEDAEHYLKGIYNERFDGDGPDLSL